MKTSKPTARPPEEVHPAITLNTALDALRDQTGTTLRQVCEERPTLVCLVRHNGCTFCRETIAELARKEARILDAGLSIAVVGMSDSSSSLQALGNRLGLSGVAWVADPDRLLYRALNIGEGSVGQLLGPRVLWAGLRAALRGYGLGLPRENALQMPGTVLIHRGRVVRQYVHQTAADRPDYEAFACERPA